MRLTIERLGHLGDGVAHRPDGVPVFVPGALPGEVVEAEVSGERATSLRILAPSSDRVAAPCPHYRGCGGCSLMHASDRFIAGWKAEVVRSALLAQGLDAPFRPVITSPPRSRRRATLAGRRTRSGVLVGFHGRASGMISAVTGCLLLHPDLLAVLPALEAVTGLGASRKGEMALAITLTDGGVDLAVDGGKPLDQSLFSALSALAAEAGLARVAWNGEAVVTLRPPQQSFGAAHVTPPAGAFLQATREGETALLGAVTEAVAGAAFLADLFAGAGTFALPLAARAEVHAVEGDARMLAALASGWRQAAGAGLRRLTHEARDLFRRPLLATELARYGAVVIDPPRAGAEAQARELAASTVPVIAAVSCNPVTFARDARILTAGGYRIDWLQVVDQFRWSPHVELVARFSR
ncbi:MAG: class I SAM-dependent RNA methyltransferase [Alphaproteobacteria bacterium HGW-Alphaproteobacteria-6]|nr:MAG: class I SAM-dependent RNA methyltransferase [Alphaproteobacteria bacterium HGW-Alphaproteobacteria-6]